MRVLSGTFALIFILLFGTPTSAADLTTLSGKSISGQFVSLDAEFVTFKDKNNTELKLPIKDVAAISFQPKPNSPKEASYDRLELLDGSTFFGKSWKIQSKNVIWDGVAGEKPELRPELNIKLGQLFYYLREAHLKANQNDWATLLDRRGKRDLFVIREEGVGLNSLAGTVISGNETGDRIQFEREDGITANLPLSRATAGIVFNPPVPAVIPTTLCRVYDIFGNSLLAKELTVQESRWQITTVGGAIVTYPKIDSIAMLDFRQGNVAYLSDLVPEVNSPDPIPNEPNLTFGNDVSPGNSSFRLGGKIFKKGIWIAPETTLSYKMDSNYREFKAVLGIDDTIPVATASVKVRIFADDRELLTTTIVRKDKPQEVTLNIKDCRKIRILVDSEMLYTGNQLILGDARLQK